VGQMSGRRRPRHFREDPWVVGCCGGMAILFCIVCLMYSAIVIAGLFGGAFRDGVLLGLAVLVGIVGLLYAASKRYS
jgi:hypothetical protein